MRRPHRKHRHFLSADESGVSLVIVIAAMAIVSFMIYFFGALVDNNVRQRVIDSTRRSRDYAYKTLLRSSRDPAAIFLSSLDPKNALLKKCIAAKVPTDCASKSADKMRNFSLVIPMLQGAAQNKIVLTTIDETNVQGAFDRFGNDDCRNNSQCLFRGITKFWLDCSDGSGDCQRSGRLFIRVHITKNQGWSSSNDNPFKSILGNFAFDLKDSGKEGEDVSVPISAINKVALERCPAGAYAVGINEQGEMQCRCWVGRSTSNPNVCAPTECADDEELKGIKLNPKHLLDINLPQYLLDCRKIPPKQNCEELVSNNEGREVKCEPTWQMTGFAPPQCVMHYPTNLRELDGLIEANKQEVSRVCKGYEVIQVLVGKDGKGNSRYENQTTSNCISWDIQYSRCRRKDFDCWSRYVTPQCSPTRATCCPR